MTAEQVSLAIIKGNFSNEDLLTIGNAITFARANLGRAVRRSITRGSTVKWTSRKNPQGQQGTVISMGTKNLKVQVGSVIWTVPASLCEAV